MGKPGSDPLGAKPILPRPTGEAVDRARRAFRDYVDEARGASASQPTPSRAPGTDQTGPAFVGSLPSPDSFGGGRRYDLALSMIASGGAGTGLPETVGSEAIARMMATPGQGCLQSQATESLERPPPGAPTVRPPVPRSKPELVPQELLQTAADSALLSSNPDGSTSFDVAISEDLFADLACRISVLDGRVMATFRVTDDNTRRLFESKSRALVARLEDRGLKVQEVRVEMA